MRVIQLRKTDILSKAKTFLLVLVFAYLMIMVSFVKIPLFFSPIPITLQVFILFLSLAILREKAFISQLIYLGLGASGFSVFTNGGSGLIYILGPTGGYLIGFLLSAAIFGKLMQIYIKIINKKIFAFFFIFSLVTILIYSCGIAWLIVGYKLSFKAAFIAGIMPFVIPDLAKITLASFISSKLFLK